MDKKEDILEAVYTMKLENLLIYYFDAIKIQENEFAEQLLDAIKFRKYDVADKIMKGEIMDPRIISQNKAKEKEQQVEESKDIEVEERIKLKKLELDEEYIKERLEDKFFVGGDTWILAKQLEKIIYQNETIIKQNEQLLNFVIKKQ